MKQKHYVIGAGISGVMTALQMQKAGIDVVLVSNTPDPRQDREFLVTGSDKLPTPNVLSEHFTKKSRIERSHGSSYGGGSTRMTTRREGDVYMGKDNPIYPDTMAKLTKPVSEGGWLDRRFEELNEQEMEWIITRHKFDIEEDYIEELKEFYSAANDHGIQGWIDLYQKEPELFENADFKMGVLRTFDTEEKVNLVKNSYDQSGDLTGFCSKDAIEKQFPFFKTEKVDGVIKLRGCSFNMHQFILNALDKLEDGGVEIKFNTGLQKLVTTPSGDVRSLLLETRNGEEEVLLPDSVSLHLGAYDNNNILAHTPAHDKVMGVAGLWMSMQRPDDITQPIKVHVGESTKEQRPLMDLNIIPCGDKLIIGGGYIFTGNNPTEITNTSKDKTYETMIAVLKSVFKNVDESDISIWHNSQCSRSFSYDELPILGEMDIVGGGHLIIAGGDNTGTLSMAPTMSQLIMSCVLDNPPANDMIDEMRLSYQKLRAYSDWVIEGKPDLPKLDFPDQQTPAMDG